MKFLKNFRLGLDKEYKEALATAAIIGLHLASGALVGIVIGYYLDKWLDTRPWLLIVFTVVGIAAGLLNVVRDTKLLLKKVDEADKAKFSKPEQDDDSSG